MGRRARSTIIGIAGILLLQVPAFGDEFPPQAARGVTVPAGFAATVFAESPIIPTTLAWGPDTADGAATSATADAAALHGSLLYVGGMAGNALGCEGCGQVVAFTDERAPVGTVAEGLNQVLGIAFGPDDTLYVADNLNSTGRVLALTDGDGDGEFETQRVLLQNIPNGRHQTNGLSVGPDGMVYVANGNATDDGLECGPPDGQICNPPERKPWTGAILRVDPAWENVDLQSDIEVDDDPFYAEDGMDDESVLVSPGYRNIYDVDFNPRNETEIWTPMNGSDFPSSSDALFALDVANEQVVGFDDETEEPILGPVIEDAGFPSCLYDPHNNPWPDPNIGGHSHPGNPEPANNLNQAVIDAFGPCQVDTVLRPRSVFAAGHEGTSGIAFERGGQFPDRYEGDVFVAEWGSIWNVNGGTVTGHKVIHLDVAEDGSVERQREFMTGALPIDVTFGPDGTLFVADMAGPIYEVTHVTDAATPDEVTVDMTNGQFVPQAVTVVQGTRVRWCNSDTVAHNVRSVQKVRPHDPLEGQPLPLESGAEMNSPGDVAPGACHSFTFDHAAAYHYNSTTGAEGNTMRGNVVVAPLDR
jgi:glucose/arabinose dehydrogenase